MKLFQIKCFLKSYLFILKFVMSQHEDDLDYEADVQKLKQVWEDIKKPQKKRSQNQEPKSQTATQSKLIQENKQIRPKTQKEKKHKVIVSDQNMKTVQRNPKAKGKDVIEVVTGGQRFYENSLKNQKNKVIEQHLILTNIDKSNVSEVEQLKRIVDERNKELSLLRVCNNHNEDRIRRLEDLIESKDRQIEDLSHRERQLVLQMSSINSNQLNFNYGKVQYQNYRNDSRRLLKMLKNTAQYQKFAEFAIDDDGVRFLSNASKTIKTKLDTPADQNHFHFCTCNKAFIPEAGLWVPDKVYNFGKDFIKERSGELSQTELELLLYEINRIWREREKRIVNSVNALKANEVGKYKRKLQNLSLEKEKHKNKQ